MRHTVWVLLVALAATAMAQEAAIGDLVANSRSQEPAEEASPKITQEVLENVQSLVSQFVNPSPAPVKEDTRDAGAEGTAETSGAEIPGEVAVAAETDAPVDAADAPADAPADATDAADADGDREVIPDTVTTPETVESTEPTPVEPAPLTKKEKKVVAKFNSVVDQVLIVLSKRMKDVGAIPISLDATLLQALEYEPPAPEPEPETETTSETGGKRVRKDKNKNKNKKNRKNNNKKNKKNRNEDDVEESRRKNSNEKSSMEKNKNNSGERRNKNKNNKNKRKNNNKKNRNNSQNKRQPKALGDDEETEQVEEGRRQNTPVKKSKNNKNNRKGNKKNKRKNNNKKEKFNKKEKSNKGRTDLEAREDLGPVLPTKAEHAAANAHLTGMPKLTRNGDVVVQTNGAKHQVQAKVTVGPLSVNLKDKAKSSSKADVGTSLTAVLNFKVKTVNRRSKINIKGSGAEVMEIAADDVTVTRDDLELDAELIAPVQQTVVGAVDTARLGRILQKELGAIFDIANVVESLDSHPALQ